MAQAILPPRINTSADVELVRGYRFRQITYYAIGRPVLLALYWIWRGYLVLFGSIILGTLAGNAVTSWITVGSPGLTDPRAWAVIKPFIQNPEEAAVVGGIVLLLGIVAYLGHRAASRVIPPDLRIFQVSPVRRTAAARFIRSYDPYYIQRRVADGFATPPDWLPNDADANAESLLRMAERRRGSPTGSDKVGICVWGEPMLGTTRLAWEAIQTVAPSWILVSWPENVALDKWEELFSILTLRHARIVLWLDNLGKYSRSPGKAAYINSLPDVLASRKIQYIVVATCNELDANGPIHQQFGPLLQRLSEIRPARMSEAEIQQLAAHLTRSGRILGFNERAFDGLPGAIVLGVTGMRDTVYPSLGPQAKSVLKTIKLLRSAGIHEYTFQRVIVVAGDAFHLEPDQVMTAIDVLRRVAFLTVGSPTSTGQPTLIPSTDYFFDIAVPDYPSLADAVVAWPLLLQSLKRVKDGAALARLGDAFREEADYIHAEICYREALPSFRRSTSPLERASVEYGLGLVLAQRAAEAQEPERKQLLEQAQDYFTGVLGVVNQQNNPAIWVGAMEGWRDVLRRESQTTHTPSRIQSIEKALEEARHSVSSAPRSTTAWAEAQLNVGVLELLQARLEQNARLRWHMLDRAIATLDSVVAQLSSNEHPALWVRAHSALGDACRARADSAGEANRSVFLRRAGEAYSAALLVHSPERTHSDEAALYVRTGEAVAELAALRAGPEQLELLTQALQAVRRAVVWYGRPEPKYPVEKAEAQVLLARVLGEIASHPATQDRKSLLTQAIIEYEDAINVLDPDGTDRADEIRLWTAGLLLRRAHLCSREQQSEANFDLARVASLCDLIVGHEGGKQRNPNTYHQAQALKRESLALKSSIAAAPSQFQSSLDL